jgi:glucose-6-phosphate dehydrogenase assembly protein OpcA
MQRNYSERTPERSKRSKEAEDALLTTAFFVTAILLAALPFVIWWSPEMAVIALIGSFTAMALRAMVGI